MDPNIIKKWRETLSALLDRAQAAAQSDALAERLALAGELQDFIIDNPSSDQADPATAELDEMDQIARKAHDGLLLSALADRVAMVVGQSAELAGLTKKIQGQTAANAQSARSLRLEQAQKVVAATTDAVTAIKTLKTQIESQGSTDADVTALLDKMSATLQSQQDLRSTVEQSA
jgi:hypothetical protein